MTMIGHMDLHGDPNGLDAWTPLGALTGSITPAALHYVSSHGNGPPDIDPREHRLLINGMVERPLVFTMDELMRLPVVSRIHYIECVANAPYPNGKTLEQMHGMIGCSEWTGSGYARPLPSSRDRRMPQRQTQGRCLTNPRCATACFWPSPSNPKG